MEFCFINNNKPLDRRSQKLVRHHAMKGKNTGKTFRLRGHKRQQHKDEIQLDRWTTEGGKGRPLLPKFAQANSLLPVNPFPGTELTYFTTSITLTPSVRYLFHEFHNEVSKKLYPQTFCRQSKELESSWFELVIGNPSVFHCAMAVTRARISRHQGYNAQSIESNSHLIQALRLLRNDLESSFKPQDSSIVVAISLAIYANISGSFKESLIHLQGLKLMLEMLPGGLAVLCQKAPELGNKIRRTDLELALMTGTSTRFGSQQLTTPMPLYVVPLYDKKSSIALPDSLSEASLEVRSAMVDMLALCSYAGSAQLSAFQYQDLIISIGQHLSDYAPLNGERPPQPLDDICQLGLLAFMSTFLSHPREVHPTYFTLLSDLFRSRLEVFGSLPDNKSSLSLWLIFIHALSSPNYEECCQADSFVVMNIRALATTLVLETWQDVAGHLTLYPWVAAFHDEKSKKVWDAVYK
ncbi:uncharacterized protein BHQ10_003938 [Talaromyces amestolkiae]|uniref:Uncharacterized protein n=1 Tax=Talaromyces amestolkiae TaxID=1196081 RepID=A0A364KWJ0_TALAM|nr:uncharacterized protein BHQ10_003938 [Talaromyces amestolkiae]RAO67926.1 hypothetical protein BHQ10_003938 [Talaromyces amestolkiae]